MDLEEETVKLNRTKKLVREGEYLAEVEVDLIDSDDDWAPYFSVDGAIKLDAVREALKWDDVKAASSIARVFRLVPICV